MLRTYGDNTHYCQHVTHLTCQRMIDFELVWRLYELGNVFFLR